MLGFVAEFFTFLGCYSSDIGGIRVATIIAISGVVLTAGYILWMLQRVVYHEPKPEYDHVEDADTVEKFSILAVVVVIMLVGIYPRILTDVIEVGTKALALFP